MSFFRRIYFGLPKLYFETISATRVSFIAFMSCAILPIIAYLIMRLLTFSESDPSLPLRIVLSGMASVAHRLNSAQPENADALHIRSTLTSFQRVLGELLVWIWTACILMVLPTLYWWWKSVSRFMKKRGNRPLF